MNLLTCRKVARVISLTPHLPPLSAQRNSELVKRSRAIRSPIDLEGVSEFTAFLRRCQQTESHCEWYIHLTRSHDLVIGPETS